MYYNPDLRVFEKILLKVNFQKYKLISNQSPHKSILCNYVVAKVILSSLFIQYNIKQRLKISNTEMDGIRKLLQPENQRKE